MKTVQKIGPGAQRTGDEQKVVKIHTRMRRTKRRRVIWARILLLVFIVLMGVGIFALNSQVFKIKTVGIAGNERVATDEISRQANIKIGANILLLSTSSVEDSLLQNPLIKKVQVKRMLPDKIKILVFERQPFVYVQVGSRFYMIDDEEVVIEIDSKLKDKSLKVVNSDAAVPADVGRKMEFPRQELAGTFFNTAEKTIGQQYNQVRFNSDGITMILKNGAYVQLGDGEDLEEKLRYVPMLVQSLERAGQPYEGINLKSLQVPTFVRKLSEAELAQQAADEKAEQKPHQPAINVDGKADQKTGTKETKSKNM